MMRKSLCFFIFICLLAVVAVAADDKQLREKYWQNCVTRSMTIDKAYSMSCSVDLADIQYVVVPDDPCYIAAAETIQTLLAGKTNHAIEIITGYNPQKINHNAILIGDMTSNYYMDRLYWNHYSLMVAPGLLSDTGYGIQTVYKPIPILPNSDVILICLSNPKILEEAIASFKELLDDKKQFDSIYQLYGGAIPESQSRFEYERYNKKRDLLAFARLMQNFMRTCDQKHFDLAMQVIYERAQENTRDPAFFDVTWGSEMNFYSVVQYWDAFACMSGFTDEQRLEVDRMLINTINILKPRCYGYKELNENYVISWNHVSIPMLDMYTICRYLKHRYGLDKEVAPFFEKAYYCFDLTAEHYRPQEEGLGYMMLSSGMNMYYHLMEDNKYFYESGNAQRLADLIMMQVDNNGYAAGQGDTHTPYGRPTGWQAFITLYYYLQQGEFTYVADQGNPTFYRENTLFCDKVEPVKLDKYVGVKSVPLDKGIYELSQFYSYEGEDPVPASFPRHMTVDKLQFRSSADPQGEYLLVDGFGRGEHLHYDTGAIVTYSAMGYKFLFDADYLCKKSTDHTLLNVCRNGRADVRIPSYAGLTNSVEFDDSAFASLLIPDYRGVDWTRNIYWEKEKFFVVIDSVRAKQKAEYVLDCTWKMLDRGLEEYDGQNLVAKAPWDKGEHIDPVRSFPEQTFCLKSVDGNGWWNHRVSSDGIPSHRIHQSRTKNMKLGDYCSFQNVFYVQRKDELGKLVDYMPRRLNDRAMLLLDSNDTKTLLLVDDADYGDYSLGGKFASIRSNRLQGVKVDYIKQADDLLFNSTVPVDFCLKRGNLTIISTKEGNCSIQGIDRTFTFKQGITEYSDINGPAFRLSLAPTDSTESSAEKSSSAATKELPIQWHSDATGFDYGCGRGIATGDIDNDGRNDAVAISSTGDVFAYNAHGERLWQYKISAGAFSVEVGDLDRDGKNEIFIGTGEHSIVVLNGQGHEIRTLKVTQEPSLRFGFRKGEPRTITVLHIRDINKDGRMELIVGARSWQAQIFNDQYERQWYFTNLYHGVLELDFTDMDNDGVEDILAATRYGQTRILDSRISEKPGVPVVSVNTYTAVGDTCVGWTDINKDGVKQLLNASSGGILASFKRPKDLKVDGETADPTFIYKKIWSFDNFSYSYTDIEVLHQKDGNELIFAASETGYIYCINPANGKLLWDECLGSLVRTLMIHDDQYILAGTEKGAVFVLDSNGKVLGNARVKGAVEEIKLLDENTVIVLDTYANLALIEIDDI